VSAKALAASGVLPGFGGGVGAGLLMQQRT